MGGTTGPEGSSMVSGLVTAAIYLLMNFLFLRVTTRAINTDDILVKLADFCYDSCLIPILWGAVQFDSEF